MTRLGAAALCFFAWAGAAAASDRCSVRTLEMPIEMMGPRPVVKVGINGTQVPLLVDSGAFFSILKPFAAQQLKLPLFARRTDGEVKGVAGEVEVHQTRVERLQLLGGEVPNVEFLVGGNHDGIIMGILGRNVLSMADTEFDLANGVVRIAFPQGDCSKTNFAYWAEDKPVVELPLLRDRKGDRFPGVRTLAQVNDLSVRVLFDTGANSSVMTLATATRAGIAKEQMTPVGKVSGAGKGLADHWLAGVDRFAVGGEKVSNIRMSVSDIDLTDSDMLLGADFFLAHRIYVSKSQQRMYFTHNGGPVFAQSARAAARASAAAPASAPAADDGVGLDAAGYARRGAASASRHNYAAALADLDRACALAPDQADYLVRRGVVHMALRNPQQARRDFDAALKLEPTHPEALLRRSVLRPAAERAATLEDLKTLDRTLAPQAPERLQLAALYERFNLLQEALTQWTHWMRTRETDVSLPEVLNARCRARTRLGIEFDAALDDCDRAVRADGKDASFRESRGWLQLRRKELDRALSDFDVALALKPEQAWALYGRGLVRKQLGQADAGSADLDAARKLRPTIDADAARLGLPTAG